MMRILNRTVGEFRFRFLVALAVIFLTLSAAVRGALLIGFPSSLPPSLDLLTGLLLGAVNDVATLVFVLLLPAGLILLPTDKFLNRRIGKYHSQTIIFGFAVIFTFSAFSEFFFWEEFGCRFNFIAVDYLIYTTEVVQNLFESYPMGWLLLVIFLLSLGMTALAWKNLSGYLPKLKENKWDYHSENGTLACRSGTFFGLATTAALLFFFYSPLGGNMDRYWNEYAKNGTHELFSAYLYNQLDYRAFYKTMDSQEAFRLVQGEIRDANEIFEPMKGAGIVRWTAPNGGEKKPNVIIVLLESMGSKWLGEYAPNLNALAGQGLAFTNMMSTGTRTVRGIEALMLSVPPTPGNSIVRRPDNDKLFTLGTPFSARGYDLDFVYGGYGYFDNMNAFFAGNRYTVTDRLGFAAQSATFANAWGQCDEDLYSESLRLADRSHKEGRPFHQVLLTTSNHRPYTFPEGKIDMKTGTRRAAIKYTDYAIGKFIENARKKPWFGNTVFVFVGDHPSSIAGKTEIPPDAYGVVCVIYGPKFFKGEKVDTLCSQIDIGPTLLASLGWEFRSSFFGTNALKLSLQDGRAWISTYQLLGFRTNDSLVVLKPDASFEVTHLAPNSSTGTLLISDATRDLPRSDTLARAVASYQCAYDLFTMKKMKETAVATVIPLLQIDKTTASGDHVSMASEFAGTLHLDKGQAARARWTARPFCGMPFP